MDLDEPQSASVKTYAVKTQSLPELETYFGLLVLEYLVDQKNFGSVCVSCFFFFLLFFHRSQTLVFLDQISLRAWNCPSPW